MIRTHEHPDTRWVIKCGWPFRKGTRLAWFGTALTNQGGSVYRIHCDTHPRRCFNVHYDRISAYVGHPRDNMSQFVGSRTRHTEVAGNDHDMSTDMPPRRRLPKHETAVQEETVRSSYLAEWPEQLRPVLCPESGSDSPKGGCSVAHLLCYKNAGWKQPPGSFAVNPARTRAS
ncbi:hypothetical protein M514_13225, partial [Trichuris suis]